MLSLKVKAAALGIKGDDFPKAYVDDIILGWEGRRLELYYQSRPVVDAQLAKLSPVSLAKAEAEGETDDEKKYGARGRKILERITNQAHFRLMPAHEQGAFVRSKGWPHEAGEVYPIEGLSKTLAADLIELGASGRVAHSEGYWKAYGELRARLHKSRERKD